MLERIEIIISDTSDVEIVKLYPDIYEVSQITVAQGHGIKWVYDNILSECTDYKPLVEVVDIKTRILRYKLDV